MARTWPLLFLTFFNFLRKYLRTHNSRINRRPASKPNKILQQGNLKEAQMYMAAHQNLLLARTSLVAQSFMR